MPNKNFESDNIYIYIYIYIYMNISNYVWSQVIIVIMSEMNSIKKKKNLENLALIKKRI